MIRGRVKFFNIDKGYGFITRDEGEGDEYVHVSAVKSAGIVDGIESGDVVDFLIETTRDGRKRVSDIVLVERAPRPATVRAGGAGR